MNRVNRQRALFIGAIAAGGMAAGFGLKTVLAEGIPDMSPLYYAGTLTENGTAASGMRDITINIWSAKTGGTMLCQTLATGQNMATLTNGRFRIALDSNCKTAINQNNDTWVEVVDGATVLPRSQIGAVPYAVEANHATEADHSKTADNATNATNAALATTANAAGGSLATAISSLSSSVTALQAVMPLTTIGVKIEVQPADAYYGDCTNPSSSTIFPPGACPRMAHDKCVALGYIAGWFEGDLHGSNPLIDCVK